MTFTDVRTFGIKLYQSLHEEFFGEFPKRRYERHQIDDEDLANLIERLLQKITKQGMPHRIIVIDEVDCFSRQEKAFTTLIRGILKSKNTKTSIIGIANAVDLPFRKKHSAIAMRNCQLLFKPYDADDISSILECKKNKLFHSIVPLEKDCKTDEEHQHRMYLKLLMHGMIDPRALNILSKKIAATSGDIRVAFDILKHCIEAKIPGAAEMSEANLSVPYEGKAKEKQFSDKVKKILTENVVVKSDLVMDKLERLKPMNMRKLIKNLPRQDIFVLESIAHLADNQKESDAPIAYVRIMGDLRDLEKHKGLQARSLAVRNTLNESLQNLCQYRFIRDMTKKGKARVLALDVDLEELTNELKLLGEYNRPIGAK